MSQSRKANDPGTSTEDRRSPADSLPGTVGVTTSGVREVPRSDAGAGSKTAPRVLSIYDENKAALRRYLLRLGVPSTDLEEVLQRLMLALLRRVKNLGPPDDPHAFVFRMAGIESKKFARDRCRHPLLRDDDGERELAAPSSRDGLDQQMIRAERLKRVGEGLEKLPPADADILQMVHVEELPQAEIAATLGISLDAVNARYRRALAKLKKLVRCHCTDDDLEEGAA